MNSGEETLQCQCMQMRAADWCALAPVGVYSGLAGGQSYMKHRKCCEKKDWNRVSQENLVATVSTKVRHAVQMW